MDTLYLSGEGRIQTYSLLCQWKNSRQCHKENIKYLIFSTVKKVRDCFYANRIKASYSVGWIFNYQKKVNQINSWHPNFKNESQHECKPIRQRAKANLDSVSI